MGAEIDALNTYGGVVGEGVESGKFGSVVAIVTDAKDRKDDTLSGDSPIIVAL